MSDNSKIEWTDATWNPVTGCSVVSPGCTNCYAMGLAGTRLRNHPSRAGLTDESKAGPVWNGKVRLNEEWLTQPLKWRRPRMIFVCAHGDLFHEGVPDEWIDRVFAVMALSPQHTFQVLTKRAKRMREYMGDMMQPGSARVMKIGQATAQFVAFVADQSSVVWFPLPNVWLGVSAEDQTRADERVPDLLATPAAVRFVSAEPLLGPIDFNEVIPNPIAWNFKYGFDGLNWIIAGGESGRDARPMHPDWARSIRDQCATAGVAFFFKQWGEWEVAVDRERDDPDWRKDYSHDYVDRGKSRWLNLAGGRGFHGERFHVMRQVGKAVAGRLLDGQTHDAMPQRSA